MNTSRNKLEAVLHKPYGLPEDLSRIVIEQRALATKALDNAHASDTAAVQNIEHEQLRKSSLFLSTKDILQITKARDLASAAIEAIATKDTLGACRLPAPLNDPARSDRASVETIRPYFDSLHYSERNADLPQAIDHHLTVQQVDELEQHFIHFGIAEGRLGAPDISYRAYLHRHLDLMRAYGADNFGAAAEHYATFGHAEGRNVSPLFSDPDIFLEFLSQIDPSFYLQNHPDLFEASKSVPARNRWLWVKRHFIEHGLPEGRRAHPDISFAAYLGRYEDLRVAFGDHNYLAAADHWYTHGRHEKRDIGP